MKKGIDCVVYFERKDNVITVTTQNLGVFVKSVITVKEPKDEIFVSLTGDQCALTDIRIK